MGYKMKGSPAKLGGIQGTASHSSALKMASSPAPFIGKLVKKVVDVASKVANVGGKVMKGLDGAKKPEEASPNKMGGDSSKKITSNTEKRANLLKAVPNKEAYDKLSDVNKKGFDKAGKKAGLPQRKIKPPTKWIGTAIKVVGKGLEGRAKSQQARDDAKNQGVGQAMSRSSAVSKY
jgi:hypothetical protein